MSRNISKSFLDLHNFHATVLLWTEIMDVLLENHSAEFQIYKVN
jgi:hypothetical protein